MLWVKDDVSVNGVSAPNGRLISSGVNSGDFVADRKVLTLGSDVRSRLNGSQGIMIADGIIDIFPK